LLLQPLETQLITLRRSRALFLCMAAGAGVALALAIIGVRSHGAMGALVAICAGNVVRLGLLAATVHSLGRRRDD
jgi:O-antigen/teichoic acid export membrane protein